MELLAQLACIGISLGTLDVGPIALGSLNLFSSASDKRIHNVFRALPNGILIDTAETYGSKNDAEELIASAVQETGASVFLATKFAPQLFRTTPESVVEACRASRQRLGVAAIDLYQIHYSDAAVPFKFARIVNAPKDDNVDEVYWDGLAKCYHQGLAKNVGVCNYGPTMIRRAHAALEKRDVPLVSNQISFNLMRYGITSETKAVCDDLDIKVLSYSTLSKGVLCGKYNLEDDSSLPREPRGRYYRLKRCLKESGALTQTIDRIARSRDKSWPQIIYNWHLCQGTIPIAGAKSVGQIKELEGATGWSLSDDEVAQLDAVACQNVSPTKEFELV